MKTQAIKVELLINGNEVVIDHDFLGGIIYNIPDIKENKAIFNILATSDNHEVREGVSMNRLSKETVDNLLGDSNQETVDNILSHHAKKINETALFKILRSDNTKLLLTIAENFEDYIQCDICKIVEMLANHKSSLVRYALVTNLNHVDDLPFHVKALRKLSKDKDVHVAKEAKKLLAEMTDSDAITDDDLAALAKTYVEDEDEDEDVIWGNKKVAHHLPFRK